MKQTRQKKWPTIRNQNAIQNPKAHRPSKNHVVSCFLLAYIDGSRAVYRIGLNYSTNLSK